MLECETKNGWEHFIEFIQSRCSRAEFENWFAPIRNIKSESDDTVLEVPNVFVQEYLMNNYRDLLKEFIPERSNKELSISFIIAPPQKKSPLPPPLLSIETKETQHDDPKLNPTYRFENFIEGPSNQFVKSAALGVASRPGKTYNPLFIHGGVGLGKTHLLHAIGHAVLKDHKRMKVKAITTEGFINDIVDALRSKSIDQMKKAYRSVDVLLVDDIQFLQSRLNFEEEFCNTFEILIHQNKQIVITSDHPPSQLKLSERMVARMEWGLVAHMGIPDLETRVAIIKHKAASKNILVPNDVAFFIAEHVYSNVRQLEGAINRLSAQSRFQGTPLSVDTAQEILRELMKAPRNKKVAIDFILQNVASAFELRIADLKGNSRQREIALARQVAMYLAKELVDDSLVKIASAFGGKTHSTLLHSWKKINEELQSNEELSRQIQMIRRNLMNEPRS